MDIIFFFWQRTRLKGYPNFCVKTFRKPKCTTYCVTSKIFLIQEFTKEPWKANNSPQLEKSTTLLVIFIATPIHCLLLFYFTSAHFGTMKKFYKLVQQRKKLKENLCFSEIVMYFCVCLSYVFYSLLHCMILCNTRCNIIKTYTFMY